MRVFPVLGFFLLALLAQPLIAQKKYAGPRPPKADVPFLQTLDKLTELESGMANQSEAKDSMVFTVDGAGSAVKSPMPEPIFLFQAEKLNPERLSLYKMTVANGKRTLTFPTGKRAKNAPKPVYFLVTPLDGSLFKIEVNRIHRSGRVLLLATAPIKSSASPLTRIPLESPAGAGQNALLAFTLLGLRGSCGRRVASLRVHLPVRQPGGCQAGRPVRVRRA